MIRKGLFRLILNDWVGPAVFFEKIPVSGQAFLN